MADTIEHTSGSTFSISECLLHTGNEKDRVHIPERTAKSNDSIRTFSLSYAVSHSATAYAFATGPSLSIVQESSRSQEWKWGTRISQIQAWLNKPWRSSKRLKHQRKP